MRHFYLKTFNSNCNTLFNIILRLFQNFNVDTKTSGENLNSMHTNTYTYAVQPTHVMFATSHYAFVNEVIDNVEVVEVGYTRLQSMQEAVHDGLRRLYGYRQHRQESVRRSRCISRR